MGDPIRWPARLLCLVTFLFAAVAQRRAGGEPRPSRGGRSGEPPSRLTDVAPGYLYGVLGGAVFAGVLEKRTQGRAESVTLLAGLLVALGAWTAVEPVAGTSNA